MPLLTNQKSRLLGGGQRVTYLLRDEFTTDRAAGAVHGTAAEPGPGGNRTVTDTASRLSIAAGDLVLAGGKVFPAFGDPGLWYASEARAAGKIVGFQFAMVLDGRFHAGWDINATGAADISAFYINGPAFYLRPGTAVVLGALTYATDYQCAVVLKASGGDLFVRGGAYTNWTLLYSDAQYAITPVYPVVSNYDANARVRYVVRPETLWSLTPLLADAFAGAGPTWTNRLGTFGAAAGVGAFSALTDGVGLTTVAVSTPDVLHDAKVTRTAGNAGVVVRWADASNYIYAYLLNDGANKVTLRKVVAGTDSEVLAPTAITYAAGAVLCVIAAGTKFRVFYNNLNVGAEQTISDAGLQAATSVGLYSTDIGNTFDDATTRARGTAGEYNDLGRYFPGVILNYLFAVGDSKTADDAWLQWLAHTLDRRGAIKYNELLPRFGVPGYTAATLRAYVDTNLAAVTGTANVITLNLGANDVGALPAEAAWKADMIAMIGAFRAKWPQCHIYIARPWRRNYATECDTLATWIADIVAGYPSGVHLGMDERVWMENGDDGAAYTTDGIHYNAAAQPIAAAAWAAVIA